MSKKATVWLHGGEEAKQPVQYTGCGLDDIWLMNGYDLEEVDGEQTISVRNLDDLLEAIALSLVTGRKLLRGKEIRFLRLQLDLSQSELARLVGCDSQQIARYEKGTNRIPGAADRILRILVREHYQGEVSVREVLQALDELDAKLNEKHVFSKTDDGYWIPKAA